MSLVRNGYTFSDYLKRDKEIGTTKLHNEPPSVDSFKIALLTSFTSKGIKEVLNVKCHETGIFPAFYVAPYNQYVQEILREDSELYQTSPNVIILFIDVRSLLGELAFSPYRFSDAERREWVEAKFNELRDYVDRLVEKTKGKIIFHTFEVPVYSPMGILETKQEFGLCQMVRSLNQAIEECYRKNSQVYIFDYDRFCSFYGKRNIFNYKMYYMGDIKIDFFLIPELCEAYMSYIKPMNSINKKCLVLDLDNTLWGGIVGEDGFDGIKLGPTPEGRSFWEFQKHILQLYERGVILAVNSRNNEADALKVLNEHPYCVLKENHFASLRINWQDKVSNIGEIAREINIGLNSLVFMDDDKMNREMVRKSLPEVTVVDLPEDPAQYVPTLLSLNEFNTLQITDEDKSKGMMYAAQRKRQELQKSTGDIAEFLKTLDIKVTISEVDEHTRARVSQLTQKTNQFNMTTRRYLEEDIQTFCDAQGTQVFAMRVEDRFGDNGTTGVIIIKKRPEKAEWVLDTFLLSCRILGREIESAILAFVAGQAKKEGIDTLVGEFVSTSKNAPARDVYKKHGFQLFGREDETEKWELQLSEANIHNPEFIEVKEAN